MRRYFWFQCNHCDITEERMIKDDNNPACLVCSGDTRRLIGAPKYGGNSVGRSPALTATKGMNKPFGH
jgi:hypothetical protein